MMNENKKPEQTEEGNWTYLAEQAQGAVRLTCLAYSEAKMQATVISILLLNELYLSLQHFQQI